MTELAVWFALITFLIGILVGIAVCRLPDLLDGLEGSNGG